MKPFSASASTLSYPPVPDRVSGVSDYIASLGYGLWQQAQSWAQASVSWLSEAESPLFIKAQAEPAHQTHLVWKRALQAQVKQLMRAVKAQTKQGRLITPAAFGAALITQRATFDPASVSSWYYTQQLSKLAKRLPFYASVLDSVINQWQQHLKSNPEQALQYFYQDSVRFLIQLSGDAYGHIAAPIQQVRLQRLLSHYQAIIPKALLQSIQFSLLGALNFTTTAEDEHGLQRNYHQTLEQINQRFAKIFATQLEKNKEQKTDEGVLEIEAQSKASHSINSAWQLPSFRQTLFAVSALVGASAYLAGRYGSLIMTQSATTFINNVIPLVTFSAVGGYLSPDGLQHRFGFDNYYAVKALPLVLSGLSQLAFTEAQTSPSPYWIKTVDIGGNRDEGTSVAVTPEGDVLVAGYIGYSYEDFWLTRWSSNGTMLWSRTLSGSQSDRATSVCITPDGDALVTGYATLRCYSWSDTNDKAFLLTRWSPNGVLLWSKTLGCGAKGNSVSVTPDGDALVVAGSVSGGSGGDLLISRWSPNGTLLWSNKLGSHKTDGSDVDEATSVSATQEGGAFVAGFTNSFGAGTMDIWLSYWSPNGTLLWNRTLDGGGYEEARSVSITPEGNALVTGYTSSFRNGQADLLLSCWSPNGTLLWNRMLDGGISEIGYSVSVSPQGEALVTGLTNSFGAGDYDLLLTRWLTNGTLLWSRTLGIHSSFDDAGLSVSVTPEGDALVTGYHTKYYDSGSGDLWLSRWDSQGNIAGNSYCVKSPTFQAIDVTMNMTVSTPSVTAKIWSVAASTPPTFYEQTVNMIVSSISTCDRSPVLNSTGGSFIYYAKDPAVVIDPSLVVSNYYANLCGAKVVISYGFASGQDVLGFTNQSLITGGYNSASGELNLVGAANITDYQAALRNITYINFSDGAISTSRTFTFTVNTNLIVSNAVSINATIMPQESSSSAEMPTSEDSSETSFSASDTSSSTSTSSSITASSEDSSSAEMSTSEGSSETSFSESDSSSSTSTSSSITASSEESSSAKMSTSENSSELSTSISDSSINTSSTTSSSTQTSSTAAASSIEASTSEGATELSSVSQTETEPASSTYASTTSTSTSSDAISSSSQHSLTTVTSDTASTVPDNSSSAMPVTAYDSSTQDKQLPLILGAAIGGSVICLAASGFGAYLFYRKRQQRYAINHTDLGEGATLELNTLASGSPILPGSQNKEASSAPFPEDIVIGQQVYRIKLTPQEREEFDRQIKLGSYEDSQGRHLVGRGAFGIAYKALAVHLQNKAVVCKELINPDQQAIKSAENEARLQQEISELPYIMPLMNWLYQEMPAPTLLLFMPAALFSGKDFMTLFANLTPTHPLFPPGDNLFANAALPNPVKDLALDTARLKNEIAIHLMLDLLKAVSSLQNRKEPIVHYDIKPDNILFRKNGEANLADLGCAQKETGLIQDFRLGSTRYKPAEQLILERGEHDEVAAYDGMKRDIYAVGITLLEMLLAIFPLGQVDTQEMVDTWGQAQLNERLINFKQQHPHRLAEDIFSFISLLIHADPHKRPSPQEALANDLFIPHEKCSYRQLRPKAFKRLQRLKNNAEEEQAPVAENFYGQTPAALRNREAEYINPRTLDPDESTYRSPSQFFAKKSNAARPSFFNTQEIKDSHQAHDRPPVENNKAYQPPSLNSLSTQMSSTSVSELALSVSSEHEPQSVFNTLQISFDIPYKQLSFGAKLGTGSFGTVYKGLWHHSEVAIKQLKNEHLSAKAMEEFNQEVGIMARLRNPNIVQLYGVSIEQRPYCLVMEYLPKGSLYGVIHSQTPMTWTEREVIATDMAKGLVYLHSQSIWHRDLKSLNVLLDNQGHAKLADFGLAKAKNETKSSSTRSHQVGSVAWMAPELFERHARFTEKSDVYSYGMTVWEMTSCKTPFSDAPDSAIIMDWVKKGEREEISDDTPPKLAKLIKWCWSAQQNERPTAHQIIEILQEDESAAQIPLQNNIASHENFSQGKDELSLNADAEAEYQEKFSSGAFKI